MKTPKSEEQDDFEPDIDFGLTSHLNPDGSPRIVERHLVVPPELAGLRLDHFVKTQIARLSRTKIQQIIDTQLTRIAGDRAKPANAGEPAGDRAKPANAGERAGDRAKPANAAKRAGDRAKPANADEPARDRAKPANAGEPARDRAKPANAGERARDRAKPANAGEREIRVKSSTTVVAGDHFVIRRPARAEPACPRTFEIVHEDARMLVIDKPAGLPVHASAKFYFNTLTRVLGERFPDEPELQICHRLDRETSGCLVVARDRAAAAFLKNAIANKDKTTKQYVAVVHGQPPWDCEAILDAPLRISTERDATRIPTVRVIAGDGGSPALTRVVVTKRSREYALVQCTLVTGRQHQIRVHLAHAGFPIVGDKIYTHGDDAFIEYCDEGLTPELAALFILPRHALHACRVSLPHPDGGIVTAEAPLPADMAGLL